MTEEEKYQLYLNSREWGVLRAGVRERSQGICERCHRHPMSHTHHLTYIRKYHERIEDLQGLCVDCHEFIHGRGNADPAVVVSLNGRVVKSVYLAGTCAPVQLGADPDTGEINNWRAAITNAYFVGHKKQFPEKVDASVAVNGSKLSYVGPFIYYQHSCDQQSPHGDNGSNEVLSRSQGGIIAADMLFAWIDREDCYGTLAEIGYAAGLAEGPEIVVAGPKRFGELWFIYDMADQICLDAKDAATAFRASFRPLPDNGQRRKSAAA